MQFHLLSAPHAVRPVGKCAGHRSVHTSPRTVTASGDILFYVPTDAFRLKFISCLATDASCP